MNKSIEKFAIVRETSAAQFEEKLNAKLFELSESSPLVEFDSVGADMVARIRYNGIKNGDIGLTFKEEEQK